MPKYSVLNISGKTVGEIDLNETVFGAEYNEALIHQVVVAQAANARQGTKSTLTRSEVRGGGKKPWRQKKTGRARHGSTRSPIWIKGGVAFAPKPRDFDKKVNKKVKDAALRSALSYRAAQKELIILDEIKLPAPKTKEFAQILEALNIKSRVLFVIDEQNEDIVRASANIPTVTTTVSALINVSEIVSNPVLVVTKASISKLEEAYA